MSGRDPVVALVALALVASLAACAHREDGTSTAAAAPSTAPSAAMDAGLEAETAEAQAGATAPWPSLVRDEQWDAAWRTLGALPEGERARPEVRYVRARVALFRGEPAVALPLLEGLETALPLLGDDVARRRHEAMLDAGPFEEAAAWFSARSTPHAQLDAARAYEKAKDPKHARAAAERVLGADKRTRAEEAEARALRVRTGDPPGDTERADARWLATQGADLPAAAEALALVARVDAAHPLTAQELVLRAHVLSDAGRTDDALHALDLAAGAPGAATLGNLDRMRARGTALFHARGRGLEAAKVLSECAATNGPNAAEDAFHAARALSRADRDDDAIRGYEDVERRFARSHWAEEAAFFVPYLRMLHGEWKECGRGFASYVKDHASGQEAGDARRDGALCELLDGETRRARVTFEHLVEDEADPVTSARMADMAALGALRDGDRTHALARWTDVARSRPLSWPALVARARLAEAGAPVPPAIDPAEAPTEPVAPLAVVVPPPADMLHRLGLDADAEVAVRERESAVTAGAGGRAPEALCAAYGELGRARRRFQVAQTLPSALFAAAPGPRTRWAWECEYPSPYADVVHAAEASERLPPGLLWAVMRQESAFDPDAVSHAHAVGLMQLLPETARPVAEELSLPRDDARLTSPPYAIRVGARWLRKLLDEFHGQVPLAVAAYNGGADSVERWLSRAPGMQVDEFVERIPFKETRDYVARVMGNLARYGYLAQGEAGVPRVDLELAR
ncbi:MAG TPA: transglycosylase SLT domain-containing protein [Polyangiaceae bacterium]|jgi:soluble lytic murein transglycosylase